MKNKIHIEIKTMEYITEAHTRYCQFLSAAEIGHQRCIEFEKKIIIINTRSNDLALVTLVGFFFHRTKIVFCWFHTLVNLVLYIYHVYVYVLNVDVRRLFGHNQTTKNGTSI